MRERFSDVERVVALCANDDEHIIPAAMDVLISVMQALEDIVAYYSAKRGTSTHQGKPWGRQY